MKVLRWTIAILVLLLLSGGIWYYFVKKSANERSLALSQRIPQAPFVAHVNALELGMRLLGAVNLDSLPEDWKRIMRPPQKIGLDILADPWVFGDSNQLAFAFSLRSTKSFSDYVQSVLPKYYTLDIDSSAGYVYCSPDKEPWQLAWNAEGHALFCRSKDKAAQDRSVVHDFFTATDSMQHDWVDKIHPLQLVVNDVNRLPWYLHWLDSGLYNFTLTSTSLIVNEPVPDTARQQKSISFCCTEDKTNWLFVAVNQLNLTEIFNKLRISPELLTDQRSVLFTLDSTYKHSEKYTTYTYDGNFNKVPVVLSTFKERLDWELECCFRAPDSLMQIEENWRSAGILKNGGLHIEEVVIPYYSENEVLVCRSMKLPEGLIIDNSTNSTHISLNISKLQESLDRCSIGVPPEYHLPFTLVKNVYWEDQAGYIEFNPEQGSPLSALVRMGFAFSKKKD